MKKRMLSIMLSLCLLVGMLPLTASASTVTEQESNDTTGTAQSISANQFVKGNLSSSSDVDYYKVSLSSAGYISLTFNHEYVDSSWSHWYVTLYNSDNKILTYYEFAGNNIKSECNPIGVPAGTHYAKVDCHSNHSSLSYELKINYTSSNSWEKEFNDAFTTVNTISANSFVHGSLMNSSDVDYFKMTLSDPGYISLIFNHEYVDSSWSHWYVTLYNSDNKVLTYYEFAGNNVKNECNPIGVPAGTYYAKVDCHSNYSDMPYELKLNYTQSNAWEKEFNDTFYTTNTISTNSLVNGSLMNSSDNDYYKVALSSAKSIQLTFNHDYVDSSWNHWYVTIYNSDYKQVVSYSFAGNVITKTSESLGLSAETYYIKVNCSSNHSDVKYSFKLSDGVSTTDPDDTTTGTVTVTDVTLDKTSLELKEGETANLTATVKPTNATNQNLTWSTSNSAVATVTSGGTVKAVSEGTTTITVKTSDGGYTASCTVKVTTDDAPYVTSFSVNGYSGSINSTSKKITVTLPKESDTYTFKATTSPSSVKAILVLDGMVTFDLDTAYPLTREPPFYFTLEVGDSGETTYQVEIKISSSGSNAVFSDVPASTWYYEAVEWAVDNDITSGTSSTTFSPDASCTRAQAVTFLWRAAGSPNVSGSNPFSDVSSSAYYYKAVLWAVRNGITSGTSATKFSPDATCTRAQIVSFLYRSAGTPSVSTNNSFSDVSSSQYYYKAVQWAKAEGIAAGTGSGKFSPDSSCTRAQIVTFLCKAYA